MPIDTTNNLLPYERINGKNFPIERENNNVSGLQPGLEISIDEDDNNTSIKNCCLWCKERFFTKEKLKRRLPLFTWLPKYSVDDLKGDLIAGITVAFTIIPQGLAYAVLAGLPAQFGLYTCFIGCFMYTIFGTCKDAAVGPTSIIAILLVPFVATGGIYYAVCLSFIVGIIMIIGGLLNLGFIIEFVSFPVMSSFTSSAAITIIASQLKGLTGLHYRSSRFLGMVEDFFNDLSHINFFDLLMGLSSLVFLLIVQMNEDNINQTYLSKIYRFIRNFRNLFILIICTLISSGFNHLFTTIGSVNMTFPPFKFPFNTNTDNQVNLLESTELFSGALVISLIALLETTAVVKVFSSSTKVDATQELFALGICNLLGSFFSAFPVTGSFCRSAVNHLSGVRTQLGGTFTGLLVIVGLFTLTPYLEYIPKSVLAAIIISAVVPMICFGDLLIIWRSQKLDMIPYLITLIICLIFGLEYGIFVGLLVSLLLLLYQMARPRIITVLKQTPNSEDRFLYVKPDRNVFFPSVEYMKVKIRKALPKPVVNIANTNLTKRQSIIPVHISSHNSNTTIISYNEVASKTNSDCNSSDNSHINTLNQLEKYFIVVIDCEYMFRCDTTFAIGIRNMVHDYYINGLLTIFYNLRKSVYRSILSNIRNTNEFFHCTSEEEIYKIIQTHRYKVIKIDYENSLIDDEENYEQVTDRYWMSNSFDGQLLNEDNSNSSSFKV